MTPSIKKNKQLRNPVLAGRGRKSEHGFSPDWRKKLLLWSVGLILTVVGVNFMAINVYAMLCQSDFFRITNIKIQGNRQVTRNQIIELSGIDFQTNLMAIKSAEVESALATHPWIERGRLTRDWPNRLIIAIKENTPVALLSKPTGLYYLNDKGIAFARVSGGGDLDYPVLTGLPADHDQATTARVQEALLFFKRSEGNSFLPKQNISEIHFDKDKGAILYLIDKTFPIYLGKEKIETKHSRLALVLKKLYRENEFQTTKYIRMNYIKDKVLVGSANSG